MAELKTKKGKIVNCNILNEGINSYTIEYDGKVGKVRKDRIVSMNSLDEAVLDRLKERARSLFGKIKGWIQTVYSEGILYGFFCSKDDSENDGEVIPIVPMGPAILAGKVNGVEMAEINGYNPCEATLQYAKSIGIGSGSVTESYVAEDAQLGVARAEAERDSERIRLQAVGDLPKGNTPNDEDKYVEDVPYDEALEMIINMYVMKAEKPNFRYKYAPAFLGAPGQAKSALADEAIAEIRKLGYKDTEVISSVLSTGSEGTLFMASPVTEKLYARGGKIVDDEKWAKKPMAGIPAFFLPRNTNKGSEEYQLLQDNANGLITDENGKTIKEPQGGIWILDEFTRSNDAVMTDIMNILSGNPFGTNCFVGNRWVVIVAGNRRKDMENLAACQDFALDSAQRTRLAIYNVVLTPEKWLKWAKMMNKDLDNAIPNILPEITQFIAAQGDQLYNVQISSAMPGEYVNVWQDAANGRSWEGFSNDLVTYMYRLDPTLTKITCIRDLIEARPEFMTTGRLERIARAHIGHEPAKEFMKFLRTIEFGRDEALEVYATGTCSNVQTATPGAISGIVDRLVQCNPNFIADPNAPATKLFTPAQLENVLNYLKLICNSASGAKGNKVGQTGVSLFTLVWRQFDDECVSKYPGLNGQPIILNYTKEDPNDPNEFIAEPGYEKFVDDYDKFVTRYEDIIAARQKKGLA